MEKIERIHYVKKVNEMPDFEIVDLQLFFSTRPKRLLEKDYRINFWAILLIVEGNGRHFIDFRPYEYEPGSVIFVQKNQIQHFEVNHNVKGFIIHINEPLMLRLNYFNKDFLWDVMDKYYSTPVALVDLHSDSTTRILIELIYNEYQRVSGDKDNSLIIALFESLILSISRYLFNDKPLYKTADYSIFRRFRDLVEQYYMERHPLDFYEKQLGVTKKTINQATRRIVDLSAKEFINERLHLEVKRYLSQGELMIYEIADELGFDEPANLTKFFRRYENMSPKNFQNQVL